MTWVRRTEPPAPAHECAPPTRYEPIRYVADGTDGDLWRCDATDCGRLWCNVAGSWERAAWWQRLTHPRPAPMPMPTRGQVSVEGVEPPNPVRPLAPGETAEPLPCGWPGPANGTAVDDESEDR